MQCALLQIDYAPLQIGEFWAQSVEQTISGAVFSSEQSGIYSRRLAAETFAKLFRKKNFSQLTTIYYIASAVETKGKNVMHVAFASALINSPN